MLLAACATAPAAAQEPVPEATPQATPEASVPAHPRPTARSAYTARVTAPTVARTKPGRGRTLDTVGTRTPFWGGPNVLLVLDARVVDGQAYVKVLLKRMPAGSSGWIRADRVKLERTRRRVVVDLSDRTVTLLKGGRRTFRAKVIVGAKATPTPTGLFAADAPVDLPGGNELGRRILAITAYSRALARYQGGIPQIAFHEYEQLGAPLGTAASHGCVRMARATLAKLRREVPRGTPVLIRP
ncbi:L,D-transpeptidase [Solirubrobacter phytolaccae]|uniref:L,D-transpeptidase n=1 Tax=Solirubrobacter phytolaccae TaxID=1404360 RepID=A0A9X3NFI8_9ACTN|nr:L,D-transpeptidase [Solirubrobacter phytolaccae]MDA0185249.1 L,D-transpeptidase [Solirubrobacter phytolaccae]